MVELNVISLSRKFGKKIVLNDLTFSSTAQVIGIAGSNGSGKSTLLRTLSGLLKPTAGHVRWKIDQQEIEPIKLRSYMGFTAPYIELYEELTVQENLEFIIKARGESDLSCMNNTLQQLDSTDLLQQFYGSLSTGQRQRIKLAAALIHKPRILFLDEPGSNLDSKGIQTVNDIINHFKGPKNMVIIASNLKQELDLCDQIIELKNIE
ncbi:MAG: ABC transporter ATP-binding protein [Balneolaceae bacterium]